MWKPSSGNRMGSSNRLDKRRKLGVKEKKTTVNICVEKTESRERMLKSKELNICVK
jgi:hypothetical protein